jgi:DNA-binding transcriptional ArsR family regulator
MYKDECMNATTARTIEVVGQRDRVEVLMHPLRLRILESARVPASAAELARRLALTPQRVNYHVHRLAEHGFLEKVEERRAGNVVETVYGATAERYVLASTVLGGLAPDRTTGERLTAARWLWLQSRAEAELAEVFRQSAASGRPVPAISMDAEVRFETREQGARFAGALREAVMSVVEEHTSPALTSQGSAASGQLFRLVVGCYPVPEAGGPNELPGEAPSTSEEPEDEKGSEAHD